MHDMFVGIRQKRPLPITARLTLDSVLDALGYQGRSPLCEPCVEGQHLCPCEHHREANAMPVPLRLGDISIRAMKHLLFAIWLLSWFSLLAAAPQRSERPPKPNVVTEQDACIAPPENYRPRRDRSAGQRCAFGVDCDSGFCIPAEGHAYCAGTLLDEGSSCRQEFGAGWRSGLFKLCDGADDFCSGQVASLCFLPGSKDAPLPAGSDQDPRTRLSPCRQHEDCAEQEACLIDPDTTMGQCVAECSGIAKGPVVSSDNFAVDFCEKPPTPCEPGFTCAADRNEQNYWCAPGAGGLNVEALGARGDDQVDDSLAFQCALETVEKAGGGTVCIPEGVFDTSIVLLIGDYTTLAGTGSGSVIRRADVQHFAIPRFRGRDVNGDCNPIGAAHGKLIIRNSQYGCGNEGIVLRDFKIDGSQMGDVYMNSKDEFDANAGTIGFSRVRNTHVEGLEIVDVPQDAVFFKDSGLNCSVTKCRIDGFNMHWYNGAGVNLEMHDGYDPAYVGTLRVEDNDITNRAPGFCTKWGLGDRTRSPVCVDNDDCDPKVQDNICLNLEVFGVKPSGLDASMYIANNRIRTTNLHWAIAVTGTGDGRTVVVGNTIEPLASAPRNGPWPGRVQGIRTQSANVDIIKNYIVGSGEFPDGTAINVAFEANSSDIDVARNVVTNFHTAGAPAVEIRTFNGFTMRENRIENFRGGDGLVIGRCSDPIIQNGLIHDTFLHMPNLAPGLFAFVQRNVGNMDVQGTVTTTIVPVGVDPCL